MAKDKPQIVRKEPNGSRVMDIYCAFDGRFLGKGYVQDGEMYIFCKQCKNFTAVLGVKQNEQLTGADLNARVRLK